MNVSAPDDLDFDEGLDFEVDVDQETFDEDATIVADAIASIEPRPAAPTPSLLPAVDLKPVPVLHIFESGSMQVQHALAVHGVMSKTVGLGGELMGLVQAGEVSGILFSPHMDAEMRTFLVRSLRGRFPKIPLIVTSTIAFSAAEKQTFGAAGVRAVLPWPLPPASELLPALDALLLEDSPKDPVPKRGTMPALNELEVLRRKVAVLEKERTDVRATIINPDAFQKAVQEVAQKTSENTSLRSEMTILRQRTGVLEARIARLTSDLERAQANVAASLPDASPHDVNARTKEISEELVVLLEGADAFLWPLGQAIDFFDDLAHEAAAQRVPSLEAHVRSLKLLQGLLERVRDGFHDAD